MATIDLSKVNTGWFENVIQFYNRSYQTANTALQFVHDAESKVGSPGALRFWFTYIIIDIT